ncbi:MAG: bacillithiol biosynthesis cysteine-adding enzyme BshC [Kofleriaceae bacterium]
MTAGHDSLPGLDPETRAAVVARARRALAPEVHRALVAQNARLAASAARDVHLAALASGAAAVVTGQQVGLFLGPLYTLYKAASAIVLARVLAAETGVPVVPVFWLQTEDHDLVEIASCDVAAGASCETIAVPIDPANRISIAHLRFPDAIEARVATLAELLGSGPDASTHLERVRRHYRAGAAWSDAFAGLLAELFAPEGLIVIDPRDPALAAMVAPVHVRAIADAPQISRALVQRSNELSRAGKPVPVHVRAGAPLSFFHPDGAEGPRVRLEPSNRDAFVEVGGERVHARGAVLAALAADPRSCSTSALLRPIVQDTLLPTAAYVGGPAELAYFAQLPPLYRAFDRPMPLIVERGHFRIVHQRARRVLERLGLTATQLERCSEPELLARLRRPIVGDVAGQLFGPFAAAHQAFASQQAGDHPAIARALAKTRAAVERSVQRFAAKFERLSAYEDVELVDAVRRARAWLAPDGELQERRLGLPCFAARLGDRYIVERVVAAAAPFDPSVQELS